MNRSALAAMFCVFVSLNAFAQAKKTKKVTTTKNAFMTTTTTTTTKTVPAPSASPGATVNNSQGYSAPPRSAPSRTAPHSSPSLSPPNSLQNSSMTYATPAPPPPARSPWRAVYVGEYYGPRLGNFILNQTQGPLDAGPRYGSFDHSVKLGYAITPNHIIGTQIRARSPFDPATAFFFKNLRFYVTWANMADTKDLNIGTVLDVELPTTDAARQNGNILNLNFKINWELKTQLRNWSFTAMTLLRPMFYNNVVNATGNYQTDFYVGLYPWITMDMSPGWQLLFEASFDASHSYEESIFSFGQDEPDYIGVGVIHSFSPHFQIQPEFRFWTADISFKSAVLYTAVTLAL